MPIITLARQCAVPHKTGDGNAVREKREMARTEIHTCDAIQSGGPVASTESLALRVTRSVAAIVVGIAAFFFSLAPVWSVDAALTGLARPGDAGTGSLLIKPVGEGDNGYVDAVRLGVDVDL